MKIALEEANVKDADVIYKIQQKAFQPLLDKYQDYDTNPVNENIERVIKRIINPPKLSMKLSQSSIDLSNYDCFHTLQHGIYYALAQMGRKIE